MYKVSDLKNFREGDGKRQFEVVAVLRSVQVRTAKNASEFLMLEFGDNSGAFSAMCFEGSAAFEPLKGAESGDVFELRGVSDFYQGRFSPKIDGARKLERSEIDEVYASLAPVSPFDPQKMRAELEALIASIADENLRNTVNFAIESTAGKFWTSTAAVKMHHAYLYGLLEHSLRCGRMAAALAPLYPNVDRDLALAGAIVHDVGKVIEYSQGLAPDRTKLGLLQGHVVLGYRIIRRAGIKNNLNDDLLARLEHIVLSHQGEPEWGAAVRAATPEAVFVSSIDNFDAKMGAIEAALAGCETEFVDVPALKVKVLASKVDHEEK